MIKWIREEPPPPKKEESVWSGWPLRQNLDSTHRIPQTHPACSRSRDGRSRQRQHVCIKSFRQHVRLDVLFLRIPCSLPDMKNSRTSLLANAALLPRPALFPGLIDDFVVAVLNDYSESAKAKHNVLCVWVCSFASHPARCPT